MRSSSMFQGAVGAAFLLCSSLAYATCMAPSGEYAGAFSGAYVDANGNLLRDYALVMFLNFHSDGSGFESEAGKRNGGGVYGRFTAQNTFPAFGTLGHQFYPDTCSGEVTLSVGTVWLYVVTNNGNTIKGTMFSNNSNMLVGLVQLDKI
jgi:hypothetical protein